MRFRQNLARQVNIDLDEMKGFGGDKAWSNVKDEPLVLLLSHSDCDGEIVQAHCEPLRNRLIEIKMGLYDYSAQSFEKGQKWEMDYYKFMYYLQRWIDGLESAINLGEPVEFM